MSEVLKCLKWLVAAPKYVHMSNVNAVAQQALDAYKVEGEERPDSTVQGLVHLLLKASQEVEELNAEAADLRHKVEVLEKEADRDINVTEMADMLHLMGIKDNPKILPIRILRSIFKIGLKDAKLAMDSAIQRGKKVAPEEFPW